MAGGTVWSRPPAVISSGPRVLLLVLTLAGERGARFAIAASNSGRPVREWPALVELGGLLLGQGVAEAVAECSAGERDCLVPVRGPARRDRGDPQRRGRERRSRR